MISSQHEYDLTSSTDSIFDETVEFETDHNQTNDAPSSVICHERQSVTGNQKNLSNFLFRAHKYPHIIHKFLIAEVFATGNMIVLPIKHFSQISDFLEVNPEVPNIRLESKSVNVDVNGSVLATNFLILLEFDFEVVTIGTYLKFQTQKPAKFHVDFYVSQIRENGVQRKSVMVKSDQVLNKYFGVKIKLSQNEVEKFLDHKGTLKIGAKVQPA